jgi:DnaJ-class molecular chaperone
MTMTAAKARRIIGVETHFDEDILKKKYRQLAMDLHPDRHPGDKVKEEQFKSATEAYTLLSNGLKQGLGSGEDSAWETVRDIYQEGRMKYGSDEWGTGAQTAADIYNVIIAGQNPQIDVMLEDVMESVIDELMSDEFDIDEDMDF